MGTEVGFRGGAKIVHAGGSHIWETIRMYCTGVCTPYLAPLHDKHAVDKAFWRARTRSQPIKPQCALTAQVRTYICSYYVPGSRLNHDSWAIHGMYRICHDFIDANLLSPWYPVKLASMHVVTCVLLVLRITGTVRAIHTSRL